MITDDKTRVTFSSNFELTYPFHSSILFSS
nr:MAG TPA: hypothetical protein [Caudoviricetes sp.]